MKPAFQFIFIIVFFIAGILCSSVGYAQERSFRVTVHSIEDSLITLPNEFIIPGSIHITIDSTIILQEGRDFVIDSGFHTLTLSLQTRKTFFSIPSGELRTAPSRIIEVRYSVIPLNLHRIYSRYQFPNDSNRSALQVSRLDTVINNSQTNIASNENIMNLTKSGGITRGIQAGNTQDLSFTNSFNLTFSGNLGDELSFKGALSEESTPLQPEGNTQTLRDIDRIYIEMTAGKTFQATLGDYTLDLHPKKAFFSYRQDEGLDPIFNNFSRKVLGVKTVLDVGPTELLLSASATKGKFTTFAFQGLDAVQGPYRLQGKSGERNIIVIAGTEHIYIDGIQLVRGELNDYVIDYGLSEIRFSNKRIITSNSRITVDFEYTDQQYSRTLIAGSQTTQFFDNRIQFSASYIREGDNQNAPLNLNLSDSDKTLLTNAGADPTKASKSGVLFAGKDSLGRARGNYSRIDTVINGKTISLYRFSPFDTVNAVYNIAFGNAGLNKGSYIRNGIGQYSFVGIGSGDYDTTTYLPLPQRNQIFTGQLTFFPLQSLALTAELALSDLQQNLFAPTNSIQDHAYHLYGSYSDTVGTLRIGANYLERYSGANFTPIDRDRKPEELRSYGLDAPIDNYSFTISSERERKTSLSFGVSNLALQLLYGSYERGIGIYSAERFGGIATMAEDSSWLPRLIISASHIPTSDSSIGVKSVWDSYSVLTSKTLKFNLSFITPSLDYISETKRSNSFASSDTLTKQSFRYHQFTPKIDWRLSDKINFGASIQFRSDDSSRTGMFTHISDGTTYQFSSSLLNLSGFSSQLDIGYRRKNYADSLSKVLNGGDISSVLLRFQPRYQSSNNIINIDGIYEASEQRSARVERIFFPVQKGLGNYKYLGDLNGNGKQDPEEFALATYSDEGAFILLTIPTEALFPVTDLRSSLRIRTNPLPFLGTETSIRIEENSSDPHSSDIYLFKLSHFLNDSSTIHGLIETQQDINILDNDPTQSYRLRFLERKNSAQYNTGLEKLYSREFSLRGKFRPTYELSNETNIAQILDKAETDQHSTTPSHSTERIDFNTQWTYEPFASPFGFGLKAGFSYANDVSFVPIVKSYLNTFSVNGRYSITTSTRLRLELGRDELAIKNSNITLTLPYSLTQGRSAGSTWLWSLSLDVQIASGIVLTAGYNGRSELANGIDRSVVHNGRAEVRASF